jgi:drug/metabolite transporter (DMT)-like permease
MGNWGLALSSPLNAGILQRSDLLFSLLIGYLLWRQRLKRLEFLGMLTMIVGIYFVLNINLHDFKAGSIGDILLLGSAFLLAVNAEIIKHRLKRVEDIYIAFFNSGICTLFFLIATVSSHSWPIRPISLSLKGLLVICIAIGVIQFFTYYKTLRELPTWLVRVLCLGIPVVALLSSASLFHQRISWGQIGGMCLLTAGIILIALVQRSASRPIASID